jgi:signal peptidase I
MRVGRVFGALATSWFFGLGGGLASLGEVEYAAAWIATIPIAALGMAFVSPWLMLLLPIALVGSTVHAIVRAHKTDAPYRVLHWLPWAVLVLNVVIALVVRAFAVEAFKAPSSSMYPTVHIGDHLLIEKITKLWRGWQRGDVIVFVYPCDPQRDYIKRIVGLPGDSIEVRCNVLYVNGKAVPSELVPGTCTYEDYDERTEQWFPNTCSRYHEKLDGHEWDVFHREDRPARGPAADPRDFPMREHVGPPSCRDAMERDAGQTLGKLVETKQDASACEPQYHYVVPDGQVFVLGDNRSNSNDSRIWGSVPITFIKGRVTGIWWSSHESGRIGSVH